MTGRLATVFGGSGFLGRHVVRRLAGEGWTVRVAVRDPVSAAYLTPMGHIGQIVPVAADVGNAASVRAAAAGAEVVVNLVGILYERKAGAFEAVHVRGAAAVAAAAREAGARRLVHVSALGADPDSASLYARSKAGGEAAVREAFPAATVLRPSVVFGPEDDFFNRFARMTRYSPFLPVVTGDGPRLRWRDGGPGIDWFGSGGPKFQPVYVGNVADGIMAALGDGAHGGTTFELGGPRVYSMKQVMELVMAETGRRRWLLPVPFRLAAVQAWFLQWLPKPLLTPDQVRLMRRDNVVTGTAPGLAELGVAATAAEAILPTYLRRFRPIEMQAAGTRRPQT